MPPKNLLAARAVTENGEPCVPGAQASGALASVSAQATRRRSRRPPGDPAGRLSQRSPARLCTSSCPGPLSALLGPGAPPNTCLPAAPLPIARAHPPRRPHLARIPAVAPGAPHPCGPRHKGPGGVRCGRVGSRPRPPSPGPPRAHSPPGRGAVRGRAAPAARAGRRARAGSPSFRTTRAAAPARGRDQAAGGAHAPPAWLPPPALPRRPRRRPRVRPPRAAPPAGGGAASAARCRANRGRGAARPPESTLRAPQPRQERRPAAHWVREADGRARGPMTTGRGGAAAPRVPRSGSSCHRRRPRGLCDPAEPRPGAHPAGRRAGEQ